MNRLPFLDGLRGWGALAVVLYHTFVEGFPLSESIAQRLLRIFIFNGSLAVWVFFVVSGFSLAVLYCSTRDRSVLVRTAIGRYSRLVIPIAITTLVVYFSFLLGWIPPRSERPLAFTHHLLAAPTFAETLRFSLFDVFFAYSDKTLNTPLWTMAFELWGSALVLGLLFVFGNLPRRFIGYAIVGATAYLIQPMYAAFVIGMFLAEIHAGNFPGAKLLERFGPFAIGPILLACVSLAEWRASWLYLALATLLVAACIFGKPARVFLSNKLSQFLGAMSFPLYLIHAPVFYAFTLNFWHEDSPASQKFAVQMATVALSLVAARLFIPADRLGIKTSKWLARLLTDAPAIPHPGSHPIIPLKPEKAGM
ncbi:MAG: acyltransferase family protein [Ramlibacter sp.]